MMAKVGVKMVTRKPVKAVAKKPAKAVAKKSAKAVAKKPAKAVPKQAKLYAPPAVKKPESKFKVGDVVAVFSADGIPYRTSKVSKVRAYTRSVTVEIEGEKTKFDGKSGFNAARSYYSRIRIEKTTPAIEETMRKEEIILSLRTKLRDHSSFDALRALPEADLRKIESLVKLALKGEEAP